MKLTSRETAAARIMHVSPAPDDHMSLLTRPTTLVLFGLLCFVLLFSRHPTVLLHAELWGDDGWSWYPDAYNIGAASLLIPANGYLDTFQRLIALILQPAPLAWIPTLFAAIALIVQTVPCVFIISARMARVWPSASARLAFALLYVGLPNSYEVYGNLTNSQWHLAVLAFLVLVSSPPRRLAGTLFDAAVLVLSGLSGPFCLLLLPIAAWQAVATRSRPAAVKALLVAATAAAQAGFLLYYHRTNGQAVPLGAGPRMLARIVAEQIILGAEIGFTNLNTVTASVLWRDNILPCAITLAAAAIGTAALLRGSPLLRKAFVFGALLFSAALISPKVSDHLPQWGVMTRPLMGDRYYIIPMLVWLGMLFSLANDRIWLLRATAWVLLLTAAVVAIPADWRYYDMPPTSFVARAHAFAHAKPGTRMEFPLHPPGLSPMVLVKKGSPQ